MNDLPETGDETETDEPIRDSLFEAPPMGEQERMVEAILFASAEAVTVRDLGDRMPHGCDPAEALVHLRKRYEGRGVRVVRVGDAWAIRTAPDLGYLMQRETVETRKLSRAAVETLAIIAYHQPVTQGFLDHFGLESARDLPGLAELRSAGLLESRPSPIGPMGDESDPDEMEAGEGQSELFED